MGDRVPVALLVVVLLLAACSSKPPPGRPVSAPVVARVVAVKGTVAHRKAATLAWDSARSGLELHHRDAIKTGIGSTARVVFSAGNQLEIDEQSLVVIEAPADQPTQNSTSLRAPPPAQIAKVEHGSVRGVSQPGSPPVKVITPDGQVAHIRAEGNEAVPFRVRLKPGGKLEVAVLKGTARVESASGDSVTVKPQHVVEVAANRVSVPIELPPFPELTSPAVDEKFHAGRRVMLKWGPVPQAALYRVQVSDSVSFDRRIADVTVTVPELSLAGPTPGLTYVWRVACLDVAGHEGEFGFARRFVVLTAKPSPGEELLAPPDNAGIQFTAALRPVTFSWKSEATHFELVVSRDPNLKGRMVARRAVKGATSTTLQNLGAGEYHWGVFAVSGAGRRPISDKPRRLLIARRLPPGVRVPSSITWK